MAKKRKINPKKMKQIATIAEKRLQGETYLEIARDLGISKATVCRVLQREEAQDLIETGTNNIIGHIPKADQVLFGFLNDTDNPALRFKAMELVYKIAAILPSNQINQYIKEMNIQQNNTLTPDTMQLVKQILPGFKD